MHSLEGPELVLQGQVTLGQVKLIA
ncbi:hypothetical protein LCGC14_2918180, partial [marine sediment metagenome]